MNKQNLKLILKKYLPKFSYYLISLKNKDIIIRNILLNHNRFDLIFDIGAHIGLYAHAVRHNGFKGKIISFEPQSDAFAKLKKFSENDPNWFVENFALGDFNGESIINISENSVSSSILNIKPESVNIVPEAKVINQEKIQIRTLDSIIDNYVSEDNKLFVKIDAQGFEKNIIKGSEKSLFKIHGFQLELAINTFYDNAADFTEMINYMNLLGYRLASLETGWHNIKTGEMMEIDAIFLKKE